MSLKIRVHNRYRIHRGRQRQGKFYHDDPVTSASLYLFPVGDANAQRPIPSLTAAPSAQTNRQGLARLDLPNQSGTYILRIVPTDWSLDEVGPNFGSAYPIAPSRIYRPLDVRLNVSGDPGNTQLGGAAVQNGLANGEITGQSIRKLDLLLQPVWVTDYLGTRRSRTVIDTVVIHLTSGSSPYGAVRKIAGKAGAHYLIVKDDGQIIKFLKDQTVGGHAGAGKRSGHSHWKGDTDINSRSIGIEMENVKASDPNPEFSEAQYVSLLKLLKKLVAQHGIDRTRIVGHSDVAVELDIKVWDPGLMFDWPRLDRSGFGLTGPGSGYSSLRNLMAVGQAAMGPAVYGGLFKGKSDDPALRLGDNDNTSTYGGKVVAGITGQPILEMLTDLNAIGYWVGNSGPTGALTRHSVRAVMHFQHHFFATEKTTLPQGEAGVRIDRETALRIRDVAAMN